MKKRKIGILGGTFDPIHKAHLQLALRALEQFSLDEVLLMPSGLSYFKAERGSAAHKRHRAAMAKLMADKYPGLTFSDRELQKEGPTYTAETLQSLHESYPETEWYFIMGADSVRDLPRWYKPEQICSLAVLLTAPRGDHIEAVRWEEACDRLRRDFGADIRPIDMPDMPVSSSDIRALLDGGLAEKYLEPEIVQYIRAHFLYTTEQEYSLQELRALDICDCTQDEREIYRELRHMLKPQRLQHTLGVARTALLLAQRYDGCARKAVTAALLHDCGKYKGTALTHAGIGANLARTHFGIEDDEIINAVRYHTTGRPAMSLTEKIIYVADYIEPGRQPFDGLAACRDAAERDLDEAVCLIAAGTLRYLHETNAVIDLLTEETLRYYSKKQM